MRNRSASMTMAGLTLGGLLLIGSPAGAQTDYNPYFDHREDRQEQRIQQGIDSGVLTPREAEHLSREQARIQAAEGRMTADGHLYPRERYRLHQMQDRASWDIYRLKHNGRTTPDWNGPQHPGWGGPPNHGWNGYHYGWQNGNHYGWRNGPPYGWNGPPPRGGGYAHYPPYDRRENRQYHRIHQGYNHGALSPWETRYLGREQARIHAAEHLMKADGHLSPWERQRLHQMQNHASRDIYRLNHNGWNGPQYSGSQPGWQNQPRYQQARPPMPQPMMRPNANMTARQPGGFGGMVNRANFTPPSSGNGFRRK